MENQHQPAPGPDETNGKEFYLSLVRAIHEASPDGVLVVDDKGNIVSMNQRFLDVWQIPTDRVEGA
ncbi:MAG: PAS domain-containing protein, partial [Nitrospirae bacterium]|nr:PAS domain-containing protein [Nitrospirota bacterium]